MKGKPLVRVFAIIAGVAVAFGAGQVLVGYALLRQSDSFYRVDEEEKLLSITRDYSRRLLAEPRAKAERERLLADSQAIAGRGAFLAAYSRYKDGLFFRWTLAASASIAVLASAAVFAAAGLSRAMERRALRVEAAGSLRQWRTTGRVLAHEIKNALSPLSLDIVYLQSGSGAAYSSAASGCLERMDKNVKRISTLLNSFREFSELPKPAFREANLGAALSQAASRAGLSGMLDSAQLERLSRRKVYTDPEYLAIVFTNILKNAKEAGAATVSASLSGNALTLLDDGPGLPASLMERIEREGPRPGQSTKAGGNGMGLYIVFEICRMLGVAVAARNANRGLEMRMEFRHG